MRAETVIPETLDRADLAAIRRDVYAFLAGMLADAPTEDAMQPLCGEAGESLFAPFNDDGLVDRFRAAARECPLDALTQEFWDLFVVPGKRFVTPFQSVYCDVREVAGEMVRGLMMGDSTIAVTRAYRAAGFERNDARPVPPDHVAIELMFMSRLCENERAAIDKGSRAAVDGWCNMERQFLQDHLAGWLPELRAKVDANAEHKFYPALIALVCRFVDADRLYLGDGHARKGK